MDGSNQKCQHSGYGKSFLCEGCSPDDPYVDGIHWDEVRDVYSGGYEFKVSKLSDCEWHARKYGARYFSYVERSIKGYPRCFYTASCPIYCYQTAISKSCDPHSRKSKGWNIYERPAGIIYITAVYKTLCK